MPISFALGIAMAVFLQEPHEEHVSSKASIRSLVAGEEASYSIHEKEVHRFQLEGQRGNRVEGVLFQDGMDVKISALDPSGKIIAEFDYWHDGREPFRFDVYRDGLHELQVTAIGAGAGDYQLYLGLNEPIADAIPDRAAQLLRTLPPNNPGVALAVVHGGKVLFTGARGIRSHAKQDPMLTSSPLFVRSLRWAYLDEIIWGLEAEGKLSRHDLVQEHLLWFPAYDPPISIQDLLNRSTGLPNIQALYFFKLDLEEGLVPREAGISLLSREHHLETPSGMPAENSFSHEFLLHEVIRQASGVSLSEAFAEYLCKPNGMEHSFLFLERDPNDVGISVDSDNPKRYPRPLQLPQLRTCVADLSSWLAKLSTREEQSSMRLDSLRERETIPRYPMDGDFSYRFIEGDRAIVLEHAMETNGISRVADVFPHDVLFVNWPLKHPGRSMGVGLSGGRGSRPPFRSVPIEALRPLCGQFRSTALDLEVTIVERNGKILLEREGASPLWLRVPRAKRTFQPSKGNLVQSLVFRLNEEDTNDAFLLHIKGGGRAIFHRVEESTR